MEMNVSLGVNDKGRKKIYVRFSDEKRQAEGIYPQCSIIKNDGFTHEEIAALEKYMMDNGKTIEEMSKSVSIWKAFSGK